MLQLFRYQLLLPVVLPSRSFWLVSSASLGNSFQALCYCAPGQTILHDSAASVLCVCSFPAVSALRVCNLPSR
jgi:hypothetical protein